MFNVQELPNVSFPHYLIVTEKPNKKLTLLKYPYLFQTPGKKIELGNEGKKGYYLLGLRREYPCVQFTSVI